MTERNSGPTELTLAGAYSGDALQVRIPQRVGAEIEQRVAATEFDSADEYVTFVLQSLFHQFDQQDDAPERRPTTEHDDVDSEMLQERLESLGYL